MSQKRRLNRFKNFVYGSLILPSLNKTGNILKVLTPTLQKASFTKFGTTGYFFKKLAFVGLAYNVLIEDKYRILTLKSTMRVL